MKTELLYGAPLSDVGVICGTVFWIVVVISVCITICVLRYLKIQQSYYIPYGSRIRGLEREDRILCNDILELKNEIEKIKKRGK